MRTLRAIFRAVTRLRLGLALGLLGVSLALVPLGMDAIGYELGFRQGYAILVLAALFVTGAVIVLFWPWVAEAWSWLRRDAELREAREAQEGLRTEIGRLQEGLTETEQELEALRAENTELIDEFSNASGVTVPTPPPNLALAYAPSSRPFVGPDELSKRHFENRSICITDFARNGSAISEKTFDDCTIYGPAVLFGAQGQVSGRTFIDCSSEVASEKAMLWKALPDRDIHVGAIPMRDCIVRRCHFVWIWLLLTEDEYERRVAEEDELLRGNNEG